MTSTAESHPAAISDPDAPLLVDILEDGQVYLFTLNRPERLNAITFEMMATLRTKMEMFRDDPRGRVAILTGAGRGFCSGRDLKESAERLAAIERGEIDGPHIPSNYSIDPLSEDLRLWKPLIAAINGVAYAGGFMLAMQCDIRIIAEDAKVSVSSARFGRKGASWMAPLARQISLGDALELALWGDTEWTAQRAYEAGWAQRVVPGEELMATAMDYARRAINMAPQSVRNFKQAIYRGFYMQPEVAKQFGVVLDGRVEGLRDTVEGATAFAEKRRPRFIDG